MKGDYVEYLLDLLYCGLAEDKASVLIEKGKGVKKLEKRIREYKWLLSKWSDEHGFASGQ